MMGGSFAASSRRSCPLGISWAISVRALSPRSSTTPITTSLPCSSLNVFRYSRNSSFGTRFFSRGIFDEDAQYIRTRRVFVLVDRHDEGWGITLYAKGHDAVFLKERVVYPGYAVGDRRQLFFTGCE